MSSTTSSINNNNNAVNNNSNAVGTIQIKDPNNTLKSIPIYKENTKLYYKQGGSNVSLIPVQIIKVHLDDIEPYYTIRLLNDDSGNNCREKQTDNDHLTLDKPISNDEFGGGCSSEEEMERLQCRRVHWKNEDILQTSSSDVEQEDDKTNNSKSSSKRLHTWQLEQIAKHVNELKDTTEVEKKKQKILETWQLDQVAKHMKQKQSTTSSTNNDNKSKEMGDNTDEEEGEECSIITEECSIDTNDSSKDDKKTEGIEYQQQQVVAMEESWFCC